MLLVTANPEAHEILKDLQNVNPIELDDNGHKTLKRLRILSIGLGYLRECSRLLLLARNANDNGDYFISAAIAETALMRIAKLVTSGQSNLRGSIINRLDFSENKILETLVDLRHKSFAHSDAENPNISYRLLWCPLEENLLTEVQHRIHFSSEQLRQYFELAEKIHHLLQQDFYVAADRAKSQIKAGLLS